MNADIEPLLKKLHSQGRLRVWSLIITFFGDSILSKGGKVEASRIKLLMQAMRIEPGTVRTALSRLTKDHWLERSGNSKTTIYYLGERGVKEFGPASQLIYSSPNTKFEENWKVIVNPDLDYEHSGFVIQPGVSIIPISENSPKNSLIFDSKIKFLSDEISYKLLPKGYFNEINQLIDLFIEIPATKLTPLEAMITRTLLIHHWRRIVLNFPEVPNEFTPKQWRGHNIRLLIKKIYNELTPEAENWLNLPIEPSLINFKNFKTPDRF
jgi:phenylacetic acid degradation operon negative regulatory protein